ncbi:MAG: type II toxin-antitoxin system RelB/DinJ family antitoxin, partial [Saccharofermentans sp.]|nr:type II toxin-antitoxin system RelB/DinJ family antitoxin [Saccharofermentans sp.]
MASTIQLRVDDELKKKADELFDDLGMDTTTAIRMFLKQAIAVNGLPFEVKRGTASPYVAMSESEMMAKLESSREQAARGMYKEASAVSRE